MPSRQEPTGTIPEQTVPPQVTEPVTQDLVDDVLSPVVEEEAEVQEPQIEESDIKAVEESQKVPYNRFKDKVDEAKHLKEELESSQRKHQDEIQRLVAEREALRREPQYQEEEVMDLDDTGGSKQIQELRAQLDRQAQKIEQLSSRSNEVDLNTQLAGLKKTYPDLDVTEVLGWRKVRPRDDLATLAEASHNKLNKRVAAKMRNMLDEKKAKAKAPIPLKSIVERMKPAEKPKTVGEANSLLKRFIK